MHHAARLTGSAVVELNRAIAVAEAEGTPAGLALVERLDLDDFQYFHSTHADVLRRLGRTREARVGYVLSSSRMASSSAASSGVASQRSVSSCRDIARRTVGSHVRVPLGLMARSRAITRGVCVLSRGAWLSAQVRLGDVAGVARGRGDLERARVNHQPECRQLDRRPDVKHQPNFHCG